jgi:hypothetical protein
MSHQQHLRLNIVQSNDRSQAVITLIKKKGFLVHFHVRSRHSAQRRDQENINQYARPGFKLDEGISEQN